MSSNVIKIVAGIFVVLAIVLAIVAFKMSRNYAQSAQGQVKPAVQAQANQAPTVPQTLLVVATHPLLADEPIAKDSVALVPVQVAPKDYFASIDDVVGRTPLIDIDAGAPITPRFFKESNQLAKLIPAGDQALSLELNDVLGVGNFVHSGDVVDVLVYIKLDTSNKVDLSQARILLKDALVLAYDEHITTPIKDDKDANANARAQQPGRRQRTIVLAVPKHDVTRVMLGASLGELRLALHGPEPIDLGAVAASASPQGDAAADAQAPSSGLPLSDDAKAKLAAVKPTDNVITAEELAALKPKLKKDGMTPVGIQIYRGSKRETVFP